MILRTLRRNVTRVAVALAVAFTTMGVVATPASAAQASCTYPGNPNWCYTSVLPANASGHWIKMHVNAPTSGTSTCILYDDSNDVEVGRISEVWYLFGKDETVYGLYGSYYLFCYNTNQGAGAGWIYN